MVYRKRSLKITKEEGNGEKKLKERIELLHAKQSLEDEEEED